EFLQEFERSIMHDNSLVECDFNRSAACGLAPAGYPPGAKLQAAGRESYFGDLLYPKGQSKDLNDRGAGAKCLTPNSARRHDLLQDHALDIWQARDAASRFVQCIGILIRRTQED